MMKKLNMDDRLAADRFDSDDEHAHIVIDKEACRTCTIVPAPIAALLNVTNGTTSTIL